MTYQNARTTRHVILLVEDDPGDARLAMTALAEVDVEVHWVQDGREALAYLRTAERGRRSPKVDLVLLDLNLPGVPGLEVLDQIRADPYLSRTPVTILSTSASEADISEGYARQANAYVSKPILLDDYLEVVAAVCRFWTAVVRLPTPASMP